MCVESLVSVSATRDNFSISPLTIKADPSNANEIASASRRLFATWYGEDPSECIGCSWNDELGCYNTASGECFDEDAYTVAANFAPFGTLLRVTYKNKEVIVEVTDRMKHDNYIDLSKRAFANLVGLTQGECEPPGTQQYCGIGGLGLGIIEVEVYE